MTDADLGKIAKAKDLTNPISEAIANESRFILIEEVKDKAERITQMLEELSRMLNSFKDVHGNQVSLSNDYTRSKSELLSTAEWIIGTSMEKNIVMNDHTTGTSEKVTLNLGGSEVKDVDLQDLGSVPGSRLEMLFSNFQTLQKTKEGHVFLDRDEKYFSLMLEFIKGGRTRHKPLYLESEQAAYKAELAYWRVPYDTLFYRKKADDQSQDIDTKKAEELAIQADQNMKDLFKSDLLSLAKDLKVPFTKVQASSQITLAKMVSALSLTKQDITTKDLSAKGLSFQDTSHGKGWYKGWTKSKAGELIFHGIGLLSSEGEGTIYLGQFKDGKKHGYGRLVGKKTDKAGIWVSDSLAFQEHS